MDGRRWQSAGTDDVGLLFSGGIDHGDLLYDQMHWEALAGRPLIGGQLGARESGVVPGVSIIRIKGDCRQILAALATFHQKNDILVEVGASIQCQRRASVV